MQPTLPVITREWLSGRVGFGTAVYANGLLAGELLPVWVAAPFIMIVGGSWRLELAVWGIGSAIVACLLCALAPSDAPRPATTAAGLSISWWPDWRDSKIWYAGLLFGAMSGVYFATNAFLPAYLSSFGRDHLIQPALVALNGAQMPASFILLFIAQRLELRAWPHIISGLVILVCLAGMMVPIDALTIACAAAFGFCIASVLTLALTVPALMSLPADVARNSAAVFTLSYIISVLVNLSSGIAWDLTGYPASCFIPGAVCAVLLSVSAARLKAERLLR